MAAISASRVKTRNGDYSMRLCKERQVVNGREFKYVVDHGGREIRISKEFRDILVSAVSSARTTAPRLVRVAAPSPRRSRAARVSGCFLVQLIPWPWDRAG
jgi:hypothetical protein